MLSKPWDNDPLLLLVKLHLESHHRFSFLLLDAYSHQNIKNANVHLPQLRILQEHVETKFWQALLWRMTAHTFWPKMRQLLYSSIWQYLDSTICCFKFNQMILIVYLPIEKSPHDQSHWSVGRRKLGKPHGTITLSTKS